MTLRFASGSNGFIPEATGQVVAYIRNESEFPLNKYVQYIPTPAVVGVYAKFGRDEPVRVPTDAEFAWEDGDDAPEGQRHQVPFEWTEFRTFRRAYPWKLGDQAIEQGERGGLKLKRVHMDTAISLCMTNRTKRVISLLENTSNWGSNYDTANTLNGGRGRWDTASADDASPSYLAIYRSLLEAARRIHLATNGKVRPKDLVLVVSPALAIAMAQSSEITSYVQQTPQAVQIVKEGLGTEDGLWTLPERYKGFKIVVEDSPYVSERPKASGTEATTNRLYIKSQTSAVMLSRIGGLDGEYGTQNLSTLQIYYHKELVRVKAKHDEWHERTKGLVTESIKEILASNVSGLLITDTMPA